MTLGRPWSIAPPSSPPQVWAADHQSAQITWGWLPYGSITVRCGPTEIEVKQLPGPGSVRVEGLRADTTYQVELIGEERRSLTNPPLSFRTPPKPPGELLYRIATVSDMHLGSSRWGFFKTMAEVRAPDRKADDGQAWRAVEQEQERDEVGYDRPILPGRRPGPYSDLYPIRCAYSALADAKSWGAQLLVAKGDSAQHEDERCYGLFGQWADSASDLPMMAMPGNHDVDDEGRSIPDHVGCRKLPICRDTSYQDLPGVRVLVADTSIPGRGKGSINRVADDVLQAVTEADRPVLLLTHQQFQPGKVARHWPIGITAPESTRFLDRLDALGHPVVLSSGHTHRNRIRHHRSLLLTEVASTKDWPCVWAGYNVFEGGLEQTVYRVSEQSAMAWAEYSRHAVGGLWSKWSPGGWRDRCVQQIW